MGIAALSATGLAQESPTPIGTYAAPEATPSSAPKPGKKKRGKQVAPREKDTEGTEALHRFEGDPIIKSQYERGGQPLEVDPD